MFENHVSIYIYYMFILYFRNMLSLLCVYFTFTCIYHDDEFQDNLF